MSRAPGVTAEGCRYGHGPGRVHQLPDGYLTCRSCLNYARVLGRARRVLPDLPLLHDFVAAHGFEAVDRLRLAMRKPASRARGADGRYRYARPSWHTPLDEELAHRGAVSLTGGEVVR